MRKHFVQALSQGVDTGLEVGKLERAAAVWTAFIAAELEMKVSTASQLNHSGMESGESG